MADAFSVLGQVLVSGGILTDLYTVPLGTQTTISSITVCNQNSGVSAFFRISVAKAGAADNPAQYIYWDIEIEQNDTFIFTGGLTIGAGDIIRVQSDVGSVSFNLFGVEVT